MSTLRRAQTSTSNSLGEFDPDLSDLMLAVDATDSSSSNPSEESARRESSASAGSSGLPRSNTPSVQARPAAESEPVVEEESEAPSNMPLFVGEEIPDNIPEAVDDEYVEGDQEPRSTPCRNDYSKVPSNIPLALATQGRLSVEEEVTEATATGNNRRENSGIEMSGYEQMCNSSPMVSHSCPMSQLASTSSSGSGTPDMSRKGGDSGVAGLSFTSGATIHSLSTSAPIHISPELRRWSRLSSDEGIALRRSTQGEEDETTCTSSGQASADLAVPNRSLSCSLPIPIPSSEARGHLSPTQIQKKKSTSALPPPTASNVSFPADAVRSSVQESSAPLAHSLSSAPPLPDKPKSYSPAPGQPLQTAGYALLTADDLKVDRSTKPQRLSDPDAPSIDRSSKPKAPIHATLPASVPQFIPAAVPVSTSQQMYFNNQPVYDQRGQPIFVPNGHEAVLHPGPVSSTPIPTENYAIPPPAIPVRVGTAESPYSVPPPRRNVSVESVRSGIPNGPALVRQSSESMASFAQSGYEQVPTNVVLARSSSQMSGSFHGVLVPVRGSTSSFVSATTASSSQGSVGSMSRSSVSEVNDGGDYVFSPVQKQLSEPAVAEEEVDQEYEMMNPGAVYAADQ